jgi:RNA polymerase sigma factor (sigma-70 family)
MDAANVIAAVRVQLPAVMAGLARRFPGTQVHTAEVERAAFHWLERDSVGAPRAADEVFAWLFSVACQRHVMALVADCRTEIRGRLEARYRRSPVVVEDVLQSAYVKAHRAIEDKLNAAGLPTTAEGARAWFGRIAENTALDSIRHHRRRQRLDAPLDDNLANAIATDDAVSTNTVPLEPCVAALPPGDRQVAALYLTGQKPAAIAKSLDRPVAWVYERIRTAKERLRRCLAETTTGDGS